MQQIDNDPSSLITGSSRMCAPTTRYVFFITSLTVFVLGIMVWRSPIDGYLAKATIAILDSPNSDQPTTDKPNVEAVRQTATSEDFVRLALLGDDPENRFDEERIEQVRANLKFDVVGDEESEPTRFAVSYIDAESVGAVDVVSRISQHLVRHYNFAIAQPSNRQPKSKESISKIRADESKLRQLFDQHIDEHLVGLLTNFVTRSSDQIANEFESSPALIDSTLSSDVNSEWSKKQSQLSELTRQYNLLLEQRTNEHPTVKQLAARIRNLKEDIRQTKRTDFAPAPDVQEKRRHNTSPAVAAGTEKDHEQFVAAIKRYRALKSRYEEVRQRRANSERDLTGASESGERAAPGFYMTIVENAKVEQRFGGTPSVGRIVLLIIASLTVGGAIAKFAGSRIATSVFMRVEQIEQHLDVPVVATLPTSDAPPLSQPQIDGARLAQLATRSCELTLAICVTGLLIVAIWDSPLTANFANDPFGTISETVARATSIVF